MSTISALPASAHIVSLAAPGWGHQKPLVGLACKIVQERPDILVTIPIVGPTKELKRAENEIKRYLPEGSLNSNIRVINLAEVDDHLVVKINALNDTFGPFYKKLAHNEPILCTSGKVYESALKPTLAIVDFFQLESALAIRDVSGHEVPILGWNTANAAFSLRVLGPEKLGGYGDVAKRVAEAAAVTGRPTSEIESELLRPNKGDVITVPGLPSMFDYEFTSHEGAMAQIQNELFKKASRFVRMCDGMISTSSIAYEKESLTAWRDWFAETNRPFYVIGPFLPPGVQQGALTQDTKSTDLLASQNGQEIMTFLDKNLKENGKNSVIYVSFGSFFWPTPEHARILIETLLELKFPFILAHASPNAVIPADLLLQVQTSGTGILSPWAPQQLILDHPATGWFLTHCGQNSVMEALGQGMPLIAWPIEADQFSNAARLWHLDLAFEVFETRRGRGLQPVHRGPQPTGTPVAVADEMRKILQEAKGRIGEQKRQNVHRVRDAIQGTWNEQSGDALKQLRNLLTDYFP